MLASWADPSRIECVPRMSTVTEPMVFLPGRPAAERALDTRAGIVGRLILKLSIQNSGFLGFSHETDVPFKRKGDSGPLRFLRGVKIQRRRLRRY